MINLALPLERLAIAISSDFINIFITVNDIVMQ